MQTEDEKLIGLVFPLEGKMLVEDLCTLLNIKTTSTIKKVIKDKNITYHRVAQRWIVDIKDFWKKTERIPENG